MCSIVEIKDEEQVRQFFLQNKNYCSIDLPGYFDWQQLLKQATENQIGIDINKAKQQETINYFLYTNKDGNFAWRKFEIIHPVMYIYVVNLM